MTRPENAISQADSSRLATPSSPLSRAARPALGAFCTGGDPKRARFAAWTTRATAVDLVLYADADRELRRIPMEAQGDATFFVSLALPDGTNDLFYKFALDGKPYPDPYARSLPFGVDGPARLEAPDSYVWTSAPRGLSVDPIVYELHVGTFTSEGTYAAAIDKLDALVALGIDTVELLPLATFDGARGWGYDGVAAFAPYAPYGTPSELRGFIDAAHARGLSVVIDVVYNHFGPAGSYLKMYSEEYFTKTGTAWGDAPSFACDAYRRFVTDNARMWLEDYRADGLRLDATHSFREDGDPSILRELADYAASLSPPRALFAEDERNEATLVTHDGLNGVWADDFHHQLRVTLTGEREGYYRAYRSSVADLAQAINRGWLYEGTIYPPSGKPRGTPAGHLAPASFVYCIENHDQIGNRAMGDRLTGSVSLDAYRAASLLLLLLPMTPLLFMGQEWGASTPFLFFTDHGGDLGQKIIDGRRAEFKDFPAFNDPEARAKIPNPQDAATFQASKLRWEEREASEHAATLKLYREAIALRRSDAALTNRARNAVKAEADGDLLIVHRASANGSEERTVVFNPTKRALPLPPHVRTLLLTSAQTAPETRTIPAETTALYTTDIDDR